MSRRMLALGFSCPPDSFPDGVYWVSSYSAHLKRYVEGGFEIREGRVVRCAPILQDRLYYWFTRAVQIAT